MDLHAHSTGQKSIGKDLSLGRGHRPPRRFRSASVIFCPAFMKLGRLYRIRLASAAIQSGTAADAEQGRSTEVYGARVRSCR